MKQCVLFLKHSIEFLGFFMIVRVFRFLGCDRASRVGGALSRWIGPWLPVHRVGDVNLRKIFPNLSADERMDI